MKEALKERCPWRWKISQRGDAEKLAFGHRKSGPRGGCGGEEGFWGIGVCGRREIQSFILGEGRAVQCR